MVKQKPEHHGSIRSGSEPCSRRTGRRFGSRTRGEPRQFPSSARTAPAGGGRADRWEKTAAILRAKTAAAAFRSALGHPFQSKRTVSAGGGEGGAEAHFASDEPLRGAFMPRPLAAQAAGNRKCSGGHIRAGTVAASNGEHAAYGAGAPRATRNGATLCAN